jgi:hypothetical protein
MNKQDFKKIILKLIALNSYTHELTNTFKKFDKDFNFISFSEYDSLVLKALELAMNDTEKWIEYWLYELDYGKKAKENSVIDIDGTTIPLKTIDDLYNCIQEMNKRKVDAKNREQKTK